MSEAFKSYEVPTFDDVETLRRCIGGEEVYGLYPRDGTERLVELEGRFAELVGVEQSQLIALGSGMAAITGTINSLLQRDTVLAFPHSAYSRTLGYASWLRRNGYQVRQFDSGDPSDVERVVASYQPDIIFSETVGNGPDTPVLDTSALLGACDSADLHPVFILDNTLPLSVGNNTSWLTDDTERRVVVVESATKAYAFNRELAGLAYTTSPELQAAIRTQQQTDGFGLNVAAVELLHTLLPSESEFVERNLRLLRNSRYLAHAVFKAQGDGTKFTTSHPDLPDHPSLLLSRGSLVDGGSPIFWLTSTGDLDQYQLAKHLWQSEDIRRHADLGQSFGFDRARILPNANYPALRIAAGATTDAPALGYALKRSLDRL